MENIGYIQLLSSGDLICIYITIAVGEIKAAGRDGSVVKGFKVAQRENAAAGGK